MQEDQVGIGDARELPQKLRTALGNRFVSDPISSLEWGALLLRAFGFRSPTAEEARLLEGFVETNSEDLAILSGETAAASMEVDITIVKSTGQKEEYKRINAVQKVEIFAIL